jgi:hypothetical protein
MNRDTAESYDKEALIRLVELEGKLGLPAKTPDNL